MGGRAPPQAFITLPSSSVLPALLAGSRGREVFLPSLSQTWQIRGPWQGPLRSVLLAWVLSLPSPPLPWESQPVQQLVSHKTILK